MIRELQNNLQPDEVFELFQLFIQYPDRIRIDWKIIPIALIQKFQILGCKLVDAVIAAHLEQQSAHTLISENRHFLNEIFNLPFRVLNAETALEEMNK